MVTNDTGVSTTARSFDIVEYLQQENGGTMRDVAETLNLSRSTAHKHLATLRKHGYVTKNGETYHLGLKFYNKGQYVRSNRVFFEIGEEIVAEFSEELGEDIEFVVEDGGRGIVIAGSYYGRRPHGDVPRFRQRGMYVPLHVTAAGKAILAELTTARVRSIVEEWRLSAYTQETITDLDDLLIELDRIRERGFALSDEEFTEGLRAVSRSVTLPHGAPVGALSVCIPIYRTTPEEFTETLPAYVDKYANEFEKRIQDRSTSTVNDPDSDVNDQPL